MDTQPDPRVDGQKDAAGRRVAGRRAHDKHRGNSRASDSTAAHRARPAEPGDTMDCKQCLAANRDGARFCSSCGSSLDQIPLSALDNAVADRRETSTTREAESDEPDRRWDGQRWLVWDGASWVPDPAGSSRPSPSPRLASNVEQAVDAAGSSPYADAEVSYSDPKARRRLPLIVAATVIVVGGIVTAVVVATSGGGSSPNAGSDPSVGNSSGADASAITTAHGACTVEVESGADLIINSSGDFTALYRAIGTESPILSLSGDVYGHFNVVQSQQGNAAAQAQTSIFANQQCTQRSDPVLNAGQLQSLEQITSSGDASVLANVQYTG